MLDILKITFNEDIDINGRVEFDFVNASFSDLHIQVYEVWKTNRLANYQVPVGTPTVLAGEISAINFVNSFNLDWNGGNYQVTRSGNVVFIKSLYDYLHFDNWSAFIPGSPPTALDVEFEVLQVSEGLNIVSSNYETSSTNACQNVKLVIETDYVADEIVSPIPQTGNTSNPIEFDLVRGQTINLTLRRHYLSNVYEVLNYAIQLPAFLDPNNINLLVTPSPGGNTIVVDVQNTTGLDLEYSLNGTDWQTDNVFNGLAAGSLTVQVRDQFGCVKTKDITLTDAAVYSPFFYISKSNSFRFANRVDFNDAGNYKNDENTLSCEANVKKAFKQIQLFQSADIVTTQFKSNYALNSVNVVRADNTLVSVPVIQKSNNIGLKDLRDAMKTDLGAGKTGIYFLSGNIYDFATGIDTGENYIFNGTLPYWAKSGNYVRVDMAWYLIENIIYDDMKNAEIMVISNNYSGLDTSCIAGSIYNKFDYEIYEFTIDLVDYLNSQVRVKIEVTDPNFDELLFLSELIDVKVKQEGTNYIEYWNDDNTDVFYQTGIRHKIRVLEDKRGGVQDNNNETLKTDNTSILLNSEMYEVEEFKFEPLTKELWRKLMIAVSCKNVIIDGVGYVLSEGGMETEGPIDQSNLYVLKAKMIKTGGVYRSTSDGNFEYDYSNVGIPGLIDTGGNNFIKY